ncbi:MAG: TonB-dependent receptor plug domain-containing protein [Flavobacteriaceae bacterium]
MIFFQVFAFSQITKKDSTHIEIIDEIVVTATRTERQLSSLPLPAQIISKQDIQQINAMRLSDLINEQTGLITVPDFGGGEGLQMQGLDSQYTLILIDGVPLIGRSAGTLDLSRIAVGNIKQIEIVKGASSSLYGSEALGGVINIITENPKGGFQGNASNRYGTFNTFDTGLSLGYKKNKVALSAFANRYSTDGYDLDKATELKTVDPFANHTFNAKLTYDFTENTDLKLSGRYFNQKQDYIPSETLKGESEINEWNSQLKVNHNFNDKWRSYFEFYASRYKTNEYLNNSDGSPDSNSYFNQLMVRPELQLSYNPNTKNNIVLGLGYTHESLDRTYFNGEEQFNAPYVYAQYDAQPLKRLNIILGARYDNHSEYKAQFSPKIALRYEITNKVAAKGSVGYGFKAPDFRQLYFNFTNSAVGYTVLGYNAVPEVIPQMQANGEINTIIVPVSAFEDNLNSENSIAYNFGMDYTPISNIKLNLNFFRNTINDLIDTQTIASKTNGQNIFSYQNIHKVYTQGVEFNTTWNATAQLKISGGYQLLYAKDKAAETAFKDGNVYARSESGTTFRLKESDYFGLYNRSRHMANFKVFYVFHQLKMNANIRGTYRSKYGVYDSNGNNYLDKYDTFAKAYSLWDIAVNKTLGKHFVLGVGIENLFDFTDPQNVSNISRRITYFKINVNF